MLKKKKMERKPMDGIKKDDQFFEAMALHDKLMDLGDDLVDSIERCGSFNHLGPSLHMKVAIKAWKENLDKNYTEIP